MKDCKKPKIKTINHIIRECSKLAQKEYKTRHDWVVKVIHWELCKKSKFEHTNKWYMHNPASIRENEMHKFLWNFEIQMNHLISDRRPDLVIIIIIKNLPNCELCYLGLPLSKTEKSEKKDLDLSKELKKLWNMKVTIIPILIGTLGSTGTKRLWNKGTYGDHLNYSIVEIDQKTEKSPGDLRSLAVTQTPVENHQQTLVSWSTK